MHASYSSNAPDTRWQRLMSKSFGGICKPGQRGDTCLSLLDDAMGLSERDKLAVALGVSINPLKESISRAMEKTLAPQLFFTVIAGGLITWAVLAANPEPLFTKGAALISALMLIYLGVEAFLELVDATRELKRATDNATTWEELESASQRWANRVGPTVARVFVLGVTAVVSHREHQKRGLVMKHEELVEQFAQHVQAETEAGWRGDAPAANRHADEYLAVFDKLRARGDTGRDALAVLLHHPRMDVRVTAAAFLLRYRTKEARAVLEEAAKGKGVVPFEAQQALQRWEEGTWSLDPE